MPVPLIYSLTHTLNSLLYVWWCDEYSLSHPISPAPSCSGSTGHINNHHKPFKHERKRAWMTCHPRVDEEQGEWHYHLAAERSEGHPTRQRRYVDRANLH